MNIFNVTLKSERITLSPVNEKYAEEIFAVFTPSITKYMQPKAPDSLDETLAYLKSTQIRMEKGEDLLLAITKNENGEFIGQCGIHKLKTPTPTLGIWIKESAHGNGYGKEAVHLAKKWCDENLDYKYITYPVDKRNIGSRKIAESLKGKIMREFKNINDSGFELDEVEYWIYPPQLHT